MEYGGSYSGKAKVDNDDSVIDAAFGTLPPSKKSEEE